MSGYHLHPEALTDLDAIWEYIAEDDIDAADGVIAAIFDAIRASCLSRIRDTAARTSPPARCDS